MSRRLPSPYARFARAPRRVVNIAWTGPVQQGKLSIRNGSVKIDSGRESPHRYFRRYDPNRASYAPVWPRETFTSLQYSSRKSIMRVRTLIMGHLRGIEAENDIQDALPHRIYSTRHLILHKLLSLSVHIPVYRKSGAVDPVPAAPVTHAIHEGTFPTAIEGHVKVVSTTNKMKKEQHMGSSSAMPLSAVVLGLFVYDLDILTWEVFRNTLTGRNPGSSRIRRGRAIRTDDARQRVRIKERALTTRSGMNAVESFSVGRILTRSPRHYEEYNSSSFCSYCGRTRTLHLSQICKWDMSMQQLRVFPRKREV